LLPQPLACDARRFGGPPHQDLVVSLPEACQTLLGVVRRGLLLLGGAAEEPHPLHRVSAACRDDRNLLTKSIYKVNHPALGLHRWGFGTTGVRRRETRCWLKRGG
jgi:hypothetical protein